MGAFWQSVDMRKAVNNMKKKIFFTDLDGTLLNDQKEITPKTKELLCRLKEDGHYFVIITGRPLMSALEVRRELPVSDKNLYLVASNGGVIYDVEHQKILKENRLTLEQVEHYLNHCEKKGVHSHTYRDDAVVSKRQSEELTFYQKTVHIPSLITDDILGNLDKPPFKSIAISADREKLEAVKRELTPWAKDQVYLMFSNDKLLEMIPITSGKGAALIWLSEYLKVDIADTMAAGDQENDRAMIEAAGLGVAMLNGVEDVKKIADRITPFDNNHDGLVPILKEFFGYL